MNQENLLKGLFEKYFKERCVCLTPLPASGSNRVYYRLYGEKNKAIGTYNCLKEENIAFLHFSEVFKNASLNVPAIYAADIDNDIYLQQDLGDTSVFDYIQASATHEVKEARILSLYKKILSQLLQFQLKGGKDIDFAKAYPMPAFDRSAVMFDLNYFKYLFLKIFDINFNELRLQKDFELLSKEIDSCNRSYFMYRDFQTRNIMMHNDDLYYIDYQGGRQGSLCYDVASLLFSAKSNLSDALRESLLEYYTGLLTDAKLIDNTEKFKQEYYLFVFVRILQTLGAYGFRGAIEGKSYFAESMPLALNNLKYLSPKLEILNKLPELKQIILDMTQNKSFTPKKTLEIHLHSFSYKRGIPYDTSGHGGGFVFDCRGLPNPGRMNSYKELTGMDKEVAAYLDNIPEVHDFLEAVHKTISINIDNYVKRGFANLSVAFGCTGGQHRSVFCAIQTKAFINKKYPGVAVHLKHCELEKIGS